MRFATLDSSLTPEGWRWRVAVHEGHPAFEGHFPGHPVLPGIAHLAIVAHALCEITKGGARIAAVPLLRLRRPVVPGDVLDIRVNPEGVDGTYGFDVRRGEERVSNGIVTLDQED